MRKIIFRLLIILILCVFSLPFMASPALALANPTTIAFGSGTPQYNVFTNVLETGDWLIDAEGYVNYNLSSSVTLLPDGAGAQTNLTPSAGANWQCVSDSNDATYVSTASATYITDLYSLANSTVTTGVITGVSIVFRTQNSGAGTTGAYPDIYLNGVVYNGSVQTSTSSWSTKNQVFSTNPSTGNAWTWNDINSMQIGVSLASTANDARCSEVSAVVSYTADNPGYSADQAFLFELMDTTGTVTLASTTLQSYGDRPISIYLTASEVTTLGLVSGTAYIIRITGNPLIFASPTGNTISATLNASNYIDQQLGVDSDPPTDNALRNAMITMAQQIQNHDNPTSGNEYLITVQGYKYLTVAGGDIFTAGIPNLQTMCPIAFQHGLENMSGDQPQSYGAYGSSLSPQTQWGNTVATGLTNIGVYLGINQSLAGSLMLFVLAIMLAVFVYARTQSGISVILLVSAAPFLGAYLGLMPMALAFIFVIVIITLLGYFFFSRGAL